MKHFYNVANGTKRRYRTEPLLVSAKDAYTRPRLDFSTSTSIWKVDEFIRRRTRDWKALIGEDGHTGSRSKVMRADHDSVYTATYSSFSIPLMEMILVRYGGPAGGKVLDAFSGGAPRAVTSAIMGFEYHGFDIREEALDETRATVDRLNLGGVFLHHGDGRFIDIDESEFDVAITCPPYFDLETYSDLPTDLSNLSSYEEFNAGMFMCALAHRKKMKPGAFVCIVVGPFRNKKTKELIDFRADTVLNFQEAGFIWHQEVVLSKNFGSAAKRAGNAWKGKKLVPIHEYLLVFRTPEK